MTHEKYISHLKVCEFLHKEPTGQYKKLHDFLINLWKDMELRPNIEENQIIIHKNNTPFLISNHTTNGSGHLWCNHNLIWTFLQKDMNMEIPDIQHLIKNIVGNHLKCETGTPMYGFIPEAKYPDSRHETSV